MVLRIRVSLPDRPGSLGQVARTIGVCGADIVQVVVLERIAGRAVDDITVLWPGGGGVDRLLAGLGAIVGVRVHGVWQAIGAGVAGGDVELIGQLAANPADGLATLVDAAPGLFGAGWAAALVVAPDWPRSSADQSPQVAYASWQAPVSITSPEVTPLRQRTFDGPQGLRYAVAPFGRAGLVLLLARGGTAGRAEWDQPPAFHSTEVDRLAQLVRVGARVLGDQLTAGVPVPDRHQGGR